LRSDQDSAQINGVRWTARFSAASKRRCWSRAACVLFIGASPSLSFRGADWVLLTTH